MTTWLCRGARDTETCHRRCRAESNSGAGGGRARRSKTLRESAGNWRSCTRCHLVWRLIAMPIAKCQLPTWTCSLQPAACSQRTEKQKLARLRRCGIYFRKKFDSISVSQCETSNDFPRVARIMFWPFAKRQIAIFERRSVCSFIGLYDKVRVILKVFTATPIGILVKESRYTPKIRFSLTPL